MRAAAADAVVAFRRRRMALAVAVALSLRVPLSGGERGEGGDDTDACLKLTDETDMSYNIDYFSKINHFTVF